MVYIRDIKETHSATKGSLETISECNCLHMVTEMIMATRPLTCLVCHNINFPSVIEDIQFSLVYSHPLPELYLYLASAVVFWNLNHDFLWVSLSFLALAPQITYCAKFYTTFL